MFAPSQLEVRRFFCATYRKWRDGLPPDGHAYLDAVRRKATG
jgi:hypothetical protein